MAWKIDNPHACVEQRAGQPIIRAAVSTTKAPFPLFFFLLEINILIEMLPPTLSLLSNHLRPASGASALLSEDEDDAVYEKNGWGG